MKITAKEYEMIHLMECRKYEKCVHKCRFWGLCEEKAIPLVNINSAISVAEDIKKGMIEDTAVDKHEVYKIIRRA